MKIIILEKSRWIGGAFSTNGRGDTCLHNDCLKICKDETIWVSSYKRDLIPNIKIARKDYDMRVLEQPGQFSEKALKIRLLACKCSFPLPPLSAECRRGQMRLLFVRYHPYPLQGLAKYERSLSGLRHEISSPARTLGSWVRIPLKAWLSFCVYPVFVLGRGLETGWSPVQGVLTAVLD
jgi:hypothetical protein